MHGWKGPEIGLKCLGTDWALRMAESYMRLVWGTEPGTVWVLRLFRRILKLAGRGLGLDGRVLRLAWHIWILVGMVLRLIKMTLSLPETTWWDGPEIDWKGSEPGC